MWSKIKKIGINRSFAEGGYTIVEVLIVLAVTTALFVAIAGTFSGQQGRTEFTQGARDMESRVRDILNDVSTGYYPKIGTYSCINSSGTLTFSSSDSAQGENSGCIFIGRVLQFEVGGTNDEQYRIYSVAGLRQVSGRDVSSFAETKPRAIAPTGSADDPPDGTEVGYYPSGLKIGKVTYTNTGIIYPTDAVGFFSTFGVQTAAGGLKSGSISVNVVPLGTGTTPNQLTMVGIINGLDTASPVTNPSGGMSVCFISTGSNQIAIMSIGGSGRQLTVNMVIEDGTTICPA